MQGKIIGLAVLLAAGCCPGPFCEGGPGMCSRLEGRYELTTSDHEGDCAGIPESAPLTIIDEKPGYRLEAKWLSDCVLKAATPGSCQYRATCNAIVSSDVRPVRLQVTRNSSGFYGPAEIGVGSKLCRLDLDTYET